MTGDGPLSAGGVPVFIREDLLSAVDEPIRSILVSTSPFAGGNHYHLVVEET